MIVKAHERKDIGGISPIDNIAHLLYYCNCQGKREQKIFDNSFHVKVPAFVRLGRVPAW